MVTEIGRYEARGVVAEADEVASLLTTLDGAPEAFRQQVRTGFVDSREEKVLAELDGVDVSALRDVTRERLRIGALTAAGVTTVGQVVRLGTSCLDGLPGIGPQTATHLLQAADQVRVAVRDGLRFRIDLDPGDPVATALVQSLYGLGEAVAARDRHAAVLNAFAAITPSDREDARVLTSRWRRLVASRGRRERAARALAALAAMVDVARRGGAIEDARRIEALLSEPMHPIEAWEDFRLRSVAYYQLLDGVVPSRRDADAEAGHLSSELVQRVESQALDTSLLSVSLRGYQVFGARFALAQRRVLIGDEMGLGKTVQAIAAIAHRFGADGATHALVVCPASVMAGWVRELGERSRLTPYLLHGRDEDDTRRRWRERGGVAVTSFGSLSSLTGLASREMARRRRPSDGPLGRVDVLVVDEAHLVKNPATYRSTYVAAIAAEVDDVLFLTGTALENRLEEFRSLVRYLQPELAASLGPVPAALGSERFRRAVSPVYLRRNAEDVLHELPNLVQVEEWEQFGDVDGGAYRRAVEAGRFMAMRRAAWEVERPGQSGKAVRLRELVEEATDNGRKVLVFTAFLDVVEMVMRTLGDVAIGPLTGSVTPERRARVIEEFTTAERPRALVSQIDVGGVGLNLQAASVVILCEPQLKPTTEAQAIARAHRMGQVETVQVHRLLVEDSVDEHLLTMLDTKRRIFDAYARRSALAEEVADAVDVSEAELARRIVEAEQTRLFVDPRVTAVEDAPVEDLPS